ncbi:inorganic phosphate transporter [Devriesea agamarum]|uniref:inorganic phosphate transporter n=1 Tax=Devriesea agamarum TaxID=472569 RepID=UPI00071C3418|nr:inorganic phosphate transporter [Devriesea agamarum]
MVSGTLLAVIALTVAFAFVNGFHDAPNAVATSITTKALTLRAALPVTAALNLLGSLLGLGVLAALGHGALALSGVPALLSSTGQTGLNILLAALSVATVWNIVTWWFGIPTSCSHSLFSGLVGATTVAGVMQPGIAGMLSWIVVPIAALISAYVMVILLSRMSRSQRLRIRNRHLRLIQTVSACAVALGHGIQDGQRSMGVLVAALAMTGLQGESTVPWWVAAVVALALALGTLAGGRRIIRTLGRRLTNLTTPQGLAAESTTALALYGASFATGTAVSTSHCLTASIIGAGAAVGPGAVRWSLAARIVGFWVLTPFVCALGAAGLLFALGS